MIFRFYDFYFRKKYVKSFVVPTLTVVTTPGNINKYQKKIQIRDVVIIYLYKPSNVDDETLPKYILSLFVTNPSVGNFSNI